MKPKNEEDAIQRVGAFFRGIAAIIRGGEGHSRTACGTATELHNPHTTRSPVFYQWFKNFSKNIRHIFQTKTGANVPKSVV